jgi:hypothetical protein
MTSVSPAGDWWIALTPNTDTSIRHFNNPVINPDDEVLNTSPNILDNEEPKFDRYPLSKTNADLWHSAIEAEMDALQYKQT